VKARTPTVFRDELFQAQWLRAAGHAAAGGSTLGECLAVAERIREGDATSWYDAWNGLAQASFAHAEASRAAGRWVSAHDAYLRASNYFRTAYIFLIGTPVNGPVDERVREAYRRHRGAFNAAVALMRPTAERIAIPYEKGATLHGYLFRAADDGAPRPTVILVGGYDGTAEELYFFTARAAVARGYTCLAFDGPGQGGALIEDGLVFRPDWEAVVGPVIDAAVKRPEVDAKKLALMGLSFGGCLAPRAASAEPRLAACIADPGQLSLSGELERRLPPFIARELPAGRPFVLGLFAWLMRRRLRHLTKGWALRRGMWTHGAKTPMDYVRLTSQFGVGERAAQIRCPTLVCSAENDEVGATARQLHTALTGDKALLPFKAVEGAGDHCEMGARALFHERAFDWLDGVLGRAR
jgi:alpha-beta hydrolase superfamily lysophospholipase